MARDDGMASLLWSVYRPLLDGTRPSKALGWAGFVAPVVTQTVVGAGHWSAGRRRRALAAWIGAAGYGLTVWGLGTEVPTGTEVWRDIYPRIWEAQKEELRKRGIAAPVTPAAQTPTPRRLAWNGPVYQMAVTVVGMVLGVRWGLRFPRRRTALVVASQVPTAAFYGVRMSRAAQKLRPRMAAGSALMVAGVAARLRAASAEPLR